MDTKPAARAKVDSESGHSPIGSTFETKNDDGPGVQSYEEIGQDNANLVSWNGPDDPANPRNWSTTRKWVNISIASAMTLFATLASTVFAPVVPQVLEDFLSDNILLATFVVSVNVLGFAFGPLVFAPASEIYGRYIVYNVTNLGFIIVSVWGVTSLTVGGGTIADLIVVEKRGTAIALWSAAPLIGPVVGPVGGSFLGQAKGWRWTFWLIAILQSATAIACFFVMSETYAPVLLERKAKKLRKQTGNMSLKSELDSGLSTGQIYTHAITRPAKMMFLSPICAFICLYVALVYSFLTLLFTTFAYVFEEAYGFSSSVVGLVFVPFGVGTFIGVGFLALYSDRITKMLAARKSGDIQPEYRLPSVMFLGPFVPIGLFIYGWTAQYQVQWIAPMIGTALVGLGSITVLTCVQTYLVDTFTLYAASALAANTVLRSLFGGLFPLFGLKMYHALGLGWGNSLLAFLGVALCPIPILFYKYGEKLRTTPRFQVEL